MPEAIFSKGFVNPDPTSSSDASDDDDDDDTTPYERLARSREAEVNKNLDFHSRYDPAPYKENPFTRAIINGSRRSETPQEDEPSRSATEKGWTIHLPAKSKPPSRPVHAPARSGGSIPVADPNPGGRNLTSKQPGKVLGALTNDDKPQSKKASWGGWTSKGIPVIAAAPKAPKKSLSQSADEMMAKEMGKKRGKGKKDAEGEEKKKRKPPARSSTAGAAAKGKGKGKQKEEDKDGGKIVFGRIPAGAGPTSNFPIIQGLERQKTLPANNRPAPFPLIDLEDDSDDEKLPDLDILFKGVVNRAEKDMQEAQRKSRDRAKQESKTAVNARIDNLKPISHRVNDIPHPTENSAEFSDPIVLSEEEDLPSDIDESEKEEPKDPVIREQVRKMAALRERLQAQNAQLRSARDQAQSSDLATPSTITRVALPPAGNNSFETSSSALPYSSPLERYNYESDYVNPQPARAGNFHQDHIDMLERIAEYGNGWEVNVPQYIGPARSHFSTVPQAHWTDPPGDQYNSGLHSTQYSKRELSPDTPPTSHKRVTKHTSPRLAKLHRRLATVKPYRPMSPEGKPAVREEWNTLNPVKARTSDETHKKVKSSGPFRLPSQASQANQSSRSSNKVPSSTHSSRANWFRPAPISSQSSSSNNRPVFVTEAKAVSEQEGFHNQLKASIGLQGQARDYLQESTHPRRYPASPLTSSQTRFEPEPEEDWREAWSRKTASRQSNSSLSRFAYDQNSQLQEQSL